ncbi:MAG: hypothetical protein IPG59_01695 [Candidatus Melainabacteria bacterium]|nr:MAG: hypothetical protein IPG59_01695 [Candidatus Melainabacteria bacterium]
MRRRNAQIESIGIVARELSSIDFPIVFTGGAVVGLLLTDPVAADVRPTDDVDVIIGITKRTDYYATQIKLTALGFKHDQDGPICRFKFNGLILDLMPTNADILGFSNRWYEHAIHTALSYKLPDGTEIQLISAPVFIATKLEAFFGRGKQDFMGSHDLEDIIAVIDGRPGLLAEIETADQSIKICLAESFENLLMEDDFVDSIKGHLPPDPASQERENIIIERMMEIIAITDDL